MSDATEGAFGHGAGQGGSGTTTTTGETTSSNTGTTTSSSSGGGEGGSTTTTTTTTTTSTTTTTATGPVDPTLDCGQGITCPQGPGSACCWSSFQESGSCVQGPPDNATCNTAPQQGGFHTRIECQLPDHCPGQMCCANRVFVNGGSYYDSVTCSSTCEWSDVVICDINNPICPVVNNQGNMVQTICKVSQLLPAGFNVCGLP